MYEILPGNDLRSDNRRILEITPVILTPSGYMLAFPSAFFPFDGELIGLTPEYVMGNRFQGIIQATGNLPATNASAASRLQIMWAVHEDLSTMNPRTLDEIRGEILMGALQRGNT